MGGRLAIHPDPTAVLIRRVLFPAWVRKNASTRLAHLAEFERTQYLPGEALRELQWQQFRRLLRQAYGHCAFYRRKMDAAGVAPEDIRSLADVPMLPTISKEEIQHSTRDLIADNVTGPLLKDMTGGSTGAPLVFYYDEDRLDSRNAAAIRHNRWTGWDIGEKMGVLWGAPRDLATTSIKARVRDWILDRRVMLDASSLDEARMRQFHRRLLTHRPRFVLAYANTIALFARFVRDAGLAVPQPDAIITSGEVLTADHRALIETTFGCRVFNRYGSREFSVIASECAAHDGMHVNAENLLVESVGGELVVTDLKNLAMPLIRYRTRDAGVLLDRPCACGRGLPLLELRGGRTTDFLRGDAGQRVSGIVLATYAITNLDGVGQIQFVQDDPHRVTIRVVRCDGWSDTSAAALVGRVREFLGATMQTRLEYVDAIPLEASGKYRFSISTLPA